MFDRRVAVYGCASSDIVIVFHPRRALLSQLTSGAMAYLRTRHQIFSVDYIITPMQVGAVIVLLLPPFSLGKVHDFPEGCAFRSLSRPATPDYRLVRVYDDPKFLRGKQSN